MFIFNLIISRSEKYLGNLKAQYNIWLVGNIKLKKKINEQKIKGKSALFPLSLILGIGL